MLLFVFLSIFMGALAQDVALKEFVDGNRQFTAAVYKVRRIKKDLKLVFQMGKTHPTQFYYCSY